MGPSCFSRIILLGLFIWPVVSLAQGVPENLNIGSVLLNKGSSTPTGGPHLMPGTPSSDCRGEIVGTDQAGTILLNKNVTQRIFYCRVVFSRPYSAAPVCVVSYAASSLGDVPPLTVSYASPEFFNVGRADGNELSRMANINYLCQGNASD